MSDASERDSSRRRRLLAPEAIQTSAMDCGPACLKSVLEGYGIPVSYGRLREACHTDVDGTSVSALEAVLRELGVDASEAVVPGEHLFMPEAKLLPAICVTKLPGGTLHFLVAWRQIGPWVQVMDPLTGRHWVHRRTLLRDLAIVDVPVPLETFDAFVREPELHPIVEKRLAAVGVATPARVLADSIAAGGWQGFVRLEGALRFAERLRDDAGFSTAEAARVVRALEAASEGIPEQLLSARPIVAAEPSAEPMVTMRGAVAIAIEGRIAVDAAKTATSITRARADREESVWHVLARLLRGSGGRLAWLLLALVVAAGAGLVEALLFRAFFDLGRWLPLVTHRAAAVASVALFASALLLVEWPTMLGIAAIGRRLEGGLRRAFLDKLPRLADAYFQSRPVSDLATRAHQIHELRALPFYGGQLVRVACEMIVTTAGVIWLHPRGAPIALGLFAALIALPLLAQGGHEERDMRVRAHASALSVFFLDALLGLSAVRAHAGEAAVEREHAIRLVEWARSSWRAVRYAVRSEAMVTVVGYGFALALLFDHLRHAGAHGSGWTLLLVYWCLALPGQGQELSFLLQQIPRQKNLSGRLLEPLGAAEVGGAAATQERGTGGVALAFRGVRVQAGGHDVLTIEDLTIDPGSHVAIVGASGSGKSSLLGLVLGWHEPADGEVLHDGQATTSATLPSLRRQTVWLDPSVQLWNRSLLDNLRYGSPRPDAPVGAAIEDAELDEVLARLPTGLESPLGEGGGMVSGGEGQRVRFGRALARTNPRLVLFDEPFRGLERDRRQRLLARARERWRSATFLCATHDVADTLGFDRVLVVAGGRIVEDGAPRELAARADSLFAESLARERALGEALDRQTWRRWRLDGGRVAERAEAAE